MKSSQLLANRILIIDDSKTNLSVLNNYLVECGFVVEMASSGKVGLEKAELFEPDLILLDIIMPEMDGFETLAHLNASREEDPLPVILMSSLKETEHKIKGFKTGAVDYITKPFHKEEVLARVNAHLTIQDQKKQLQNLVATKDKLFSIIAHDLRSPFSSLIGYSDLLLQQYPRMTEEKILRAIDRINTSSKTAFNMLENLLNWARSQMGSLNWNPRELNLYQIVENVVLLQKVGTRKKNITITNNTDPNCLVFGNQEMVTTILRNLISNAIKYSYEGGMIMVTSQNRDELVFVSVKDTGVGIKPENLTQLFKIDKKVSTLGTANEKGAGLGLVLCKEFVEKHGGTISTESILDSGTTMTFSLPAFTSES